MFWQFHWVIQANNPQIQVSSSLDQTFFVSFLNGAIGQRSNHLPSGTLFGPMQYKNFGLEYCSLLKFHKLGAFDCPQMFGPPNFAHFKNWPNFDRSINKSELSNGVRLDKILLQHRKKDLLKRDIFSFLFSLFRCNICGCFLPFSCCRRSKSWRLPQGIGSAWTRSPKWVRCCLLPPIPPLPSASKL